MSSVILIYLFGAPFTTFVRRVSFDTPTQRSTWRSTWRSTGFQIPTYVSLKPPLSLLDGSSLYTPQVIPTYPQVRLNISLLHP